MASTFMMVLLPQPDSPTNIVIGLMSSMTRWSIGPNFLISKRSFMSAYIILSYKGAFFTFVGNGCGKTYFFLQEGATGLPRAC
jgi:hypothetical protein